MACLLKKWPALKKQCADQQPESLPRVSGCIDTRWEYTADALRSLIGLLTVVLERLTTHALWISVIEATGVDAEGVSRSVLLEMARKTRAAVVAAIEADEWLCNSF